MSAATVERYLHVYRSRVAEAADAFGRLRSKEKEALCLMYF